MPTSRGGAWLEEVVLRPGIAVAGGVLTWRWLGGVRGIVLGVVVVPATYVLTWVLGELVAMLIPGKEMPAKAREIEQRRQGEEVWKRVLEHVVRERGKGGHRAEAECDLAVMEVVALTQTELQLRAPTNVWTREMTEKYGSLILAGLDIAVGGPRKLRVGPPGPR